MARVKLSPFKLYALKLALYTGGLLYLGIDLFVWHGPLWRKMHESAQEEAADTTPTVLTVYGEKFSEQQLNRRAAELHAVSNLPETQSWAEQDLINNALLRMRARYNDSRIPDFQEAAQQETKRLLARAEDGGQAAEWLSSQGYTEDAFANKLAAVMRQQYYLQQALKEQTAVSDAEVSSMAGQIADYLVMPESRKVSHIFLSTLHQNEELVQAKAEAILAQLQQNPQLFAELAAAHSEDSRTAKNGGDLGTLCVYPAHPLAELHLFGENAIAADTPTLARSKWGWHIVMAGEIQEPRMLEQDEYAESLRTAIISYKQSQAVDAWIDVNTQEAHKKNRIISHGK